MDANGVKPPKTVVGLVGYPNVGKSSTINSLVGEKKVSVSSTPGKTKHFQTIHLSDTMVLCDCEEALFVLPISLSAFDYITRRMNRQAMATYQEYLLTSTNPDFITSFACNSQCS